MRALHGTGKTAFDIDGGSHVALPNRPRLARNPQAARGISGVSLLCLLNLNGALPTTTPTSLAPSRCHPVRVRRPCICGNIRRGECGEQ